MRANKRKDEMTKHAKCVKGEKDEKGNKWRGRKPMSPNLIRKPRQTLLRKYVHLR